MSMSQLPVLHPPKTHQSLSNDIWLACDILRRSGGSISNREYQELFLVSKRTASNDLSQLTAHGLLAVEGAGRATRYRLTESSA